MIYKLSIYLLTMKIKFIFLTLFLLGLFIQIINLLEVSRIIESDKMKFTTIIYLSFLKLPTTIQEIMPFVIIISTVLPGTIDREIRPLFNKHMALCYNPFFIAMGTTIKDFLNPEFVLFGSEDDEAAEEATGFYSSLHDRPVYRTTVKNAELVKVAYNTFIGMKITFVNTLMEICHKSGCDVDAVTDALKMADDRLISTKYLTAGMGDGGGCHPRDNIAMSWLANELDMSYDWFDSIMMQREHQTEWLAQLVEAELKDDLKKIIILVK